MRPNCNLVRGAWEIWFGYGILLLDPYYQIDIYIYTSIYIQVWQVFHVGGLMCNLEQQKLHLEIWDFSASVNSNVLSP